MKTIYADKLINEIVFHTNFPTDIKEEIEDIIQNAPPVEPERKKGKWIAREGEDDCFECSECHAVIEGDEVYWRNNYFCYHCGADMRGDKDVNANA